MLHSETPKKHHLSELKFLHPPGKVLVRKQLKSLWFFFPFKGPFCFARHLTPMGLGSTVIASPETLIKLEMLRLKVRKLTKYWTLALAFFYWNHIVVWFPASVTETQRWFLMLNSKLRLKRRKKRAQQNISLLFWWVLFWAETWLLWFLATVSVGAICWPLTTGGPTPQTHSAVKSVCGYSDVEVLHETHFSHNHCRRGTMNTLVWDFYF